MAPTGTDIQSFLDELKRRRVIRAVVAYAAIVFGLLQVADPVFAALMLPDVAFRMLVIASITGFPVVAILAWIYEITAEGLRRTSELPAQTPARPVPVGRYLQTIGLFTVVVIVVVATAGAVGRLRYPAAADDGRVGLAVYPFRVAGDAGPQWSEGVADLLATALEGTVSLRVVDPWTLWRPLRPEAGAPARAPDIEEATRFTHEAGAHRFLLGSAVPAGGGVEITVRLYQIGRADALDAFTISAGRDDLVPVAKAVAVRTLARVWGARRPAGVPAELDFDATSEPDALKAYLAAREALRRGMIDSANVAIDVALGLDSTFVLAMVEAVGIKSWGFSIRGQPYSGFFELLDRTAPYASGLNERTRLRLQSAQASVRTDGRSAIGAARRILEIDPLDYEATSSLAYYERVYGWQLDVPSLDERHYSEAVVQLDSTSVPALVSRAWAAVALGDTADIRRQIERLDRADTTGTLGRNDRIALSALIASDADFATMLPDLARQSPSGLIATARYLRAADIHRYGDYLAELRASEDPDRVTMALREGMRLDIARGNAVRVDSAIAAGAYEADEFIHTARQFLVAADLAGIGDPLTGRRAVDALGAWIPAQSAAASFETRPVWLTGWLIGAWHAQSGDTVTARRWIRAIDTLPQGGTSEDYIGSLQSDIEARMAARRGDNARALVLARKAFELWTIHTDNQIEFTPEPAMRLQLALQYREAGQADSARAILYSLVPPATWMGFLTARASYELGELEKERGDAAAAAFHFRRALGFWDDGGPAAAPWANLIRRQLAELIAG